jgi:hypothetical protein
MLERANRLASSGIASNLLLDTIRHQHRQGFGLIPSDPMDAKGGHDLLDGVSLLLFSGANQRAPCSHCS